MNLRTSFFNKSIFKSDIKRFWWTSLLETLILFISIVMPLYDRCTKYIETEGIRYGLGLFEPRWLFTGGIIFLIAFAVGVPVMLFSYIHFSASVSMYHSLPVKRSQLLWTKVITTFILTILPIVINAGILVAIIADPQYFELIGAMPIVKWCLSGILYTLVIVALTIAVNMMTGHPVGTLIFTAGFAVLPVLIIVFVEGFCSIEYFGYSGSSIINMLGYIYPLEDVVVIFPYWLIYIAMTAALFVGAYFLYKHRKLENYGEVIAFSWLKPVFIGVVAMLASMFSWLYFLGVLEKEGVWWMMPLGVIGTVIAWMVSRKSLSLRAVHKPIGIYIAAASLICIAVQFDVTGYETRVPDVDDVKSVQLGYAPGYKRDIYYNGENLVYALKGGIDTSFTEAEDIKNVIALHEEIIEARSEGGIGEYMPLEYTLKNGRKLIRYYYIDHYKLAEYLKPIYETPQIRAQKHEIVNGTEKEYSSIQITDRRLISEDRDTIYPDNPYLNKLVEAIQKDILDMTYEDMNFYDGASIGVEIRYNDIVEPDESLPEYKSIATDRHMYLSINNNYKNTMAVLDEMGYLDRIPKAQDVEKIEIRTWSGSEYPQSEKEYDVVAIITDGEIIADVYAQYDEIIDVRKYTDIETAKHISIIYTLKSGYGFESSCSYDEDKIPEIFKPYYK